MMDRPPVRCPNCGSLHTMRLFWAWVGEKLERKQVVRCSACNRGAVLG